MPQRSRYGAVNPRDPEAAATCDRGGEVRKRSELQREMVYAGARLVWNGFLCCAKHIDPPNPQDRLLVLRADPVPVRDPRPPIDPIFAADTLTDTFGAPILDGSGSGITPT